MVRAVVLVRTEVGKHGNVARAVARIRGVKAAFPTMGRADVVANLQTGDIKQLTALVLKIAGTTGVVLTETLVGAEV